MNSGYCVNLTIKLFTYLFFSFWFVLTYLGSLFWESSLVGKIADSLFLSFCFGKLIGKQKKQQNSDSNIFWVCCVFATVLNTATQNHWLTAYCTLGPEVVNKTQLFPSRNPKVRGEKKAAGLVSEEPFLPDFFTSVWAGPAAVGVEAKPLCDEIYILRMADDLRRAGRHIEIVRV